MARRTGRLSCLVLPALLTVLPAPGRAPARATDERRCTPEFPFRDGWLGGDCASSIPLGGDRTLWLFGDSFVGLKGQRLRAGAKMVGNSIGVSTCLNGKWSIAYSWRDAATGTPRAFFDPRNQPIRYWPEDGFMHEGKLHVFLSEIATKPEGGPFGFEYVGVSLAVVANPQETPERWTIDFRKVSTGKVVFPGVTVSVQGDYVMSYAVLDDEAHKSHPMILTRIPLGGLEKPQQSIEYLAKDGSWKRGLLWQDAREVLDRGHTELTIRYHEVIRKWVLVQGTLDFPSIGIGVRTADEYAGPWSSLRKLHTFAESTPGTPGYDPQTFCYAAKEHEQLSPGPGRVLVTYACNSFDFAKLVRNLEIYKPRALELKIDEPGP